MASLAKASIRNRSTSLVDLKEILSTAIYPWLAGFILEGLKMKTSGGSIETPPYCPNEGRGLLHQYELESAPESAP